MPRISDKQHDPFEDELDALALSIREELRAAGFAPAFDADEREPSDVDRTVAAITPDRSARSGVRTMLLPLLAVMLVALAASLLLPLG